MICLTSERNIVFLPCKHCCTCANCGLGLDWCAVCREPIRELMKIYLS
ncbi:RING-HC finger protein [Klebsiella pneumoniae]